MKGVTSLVAQHVLREHTVLLFVAMVIYMALYVAFKVVGDPLLRIVKVRKKEKQKSISRNRRENDPR